MDARRVGAVTTQQPPMGTLLSEYLNELVGDAGQPDDARSFAHRGQRDAAWPLQSSAYRRLSRSVGSSGSGGGAVSHDRQIEYNRELISDFRNRRFDNADGAPLTDLEALSQLQHLGAATSLIDFSRNPLAALWFACQDESHDPNDTSISQQDGAVFKVDTTYGLGSDPGRLGGGTGPNFEETLRRRLIPPHDLLAWRPPAIASAQERVVAQHSVLLLGRPLMASNPSDPRIRKIAVTCAHKERLRGELAAIGIDASSLFPDLHGFASTNGVDRPVPLPSAKELLDEGVSAYNRDDAGRARHNLAFYISKKPGDWAARLLLSNAYVDLEMYDDALGILDAAVERIGALPSWQHHILYANRANARAAMGDHEQAVADYQRVLGPDSEVIYDHMSFNRGNSYFALGKFEDALADFEACAGYAAADYNAGNTCIALGRLGLAAEKFEAAQSEPRLSTNPLSNLKAVRDIMSLIGTDQCEVEVQSTQTPNKQRPLWLVIRSDQLTDGPRSFPVAGNVGNKGNIGWVAVGEWSAVGGQGFSGSDGMIVVVI